MLLNLASNKKKQQHRIPFCLKRKCEGFPACCTFLVQLPWRQADWVGERNQSSQEETSRDSMLVRTYLRRPPSGGYTPAHLSAPAGKRACRHAGLLACSALTLSLNQRAKWSSTSPDSPPDRLIKTRPGEGGRGSPERREKV